jgi:hypothetical protein
VRSSLSFIGEQMFGKKWVKVWRSTPLSKVSHQRRTRKKIYRGNLFRHKAFVIRWRSCANSSNQRSSQRGRSCRAHWRENCGLPRYRRLTEAVPPKLYGGTERVISWLTEELVALGHEVTLFASGDSITSARLEGMWPTALRLDGSVRDPTLFK